MTPAHLAAGKGNIDSLTALIAAGANVNAVDRVLHQILPRVLAFLFLILLNFCIICI